MIWLPPEYKPKAGMHKSQAPGHPGDQI